MISQDEKGFNVSPPMMQPIYSTLCAKKSVKMFRFLFLLMLTGLTACIETVTNRPASPFGSPPANITVALTSQIETIPYTPEELALPEVQRVIKECKRLGNGKCGEHQQPVDQRTTFVRAQDDVLWLFAKFGGLEPDRDYVVRVQLFDPDNNMHEQETVNYHIPPFMPIEFTLYITAPWVPFDPLSVQLGLWRFEITVNGQKVVGRTFNVVDR